MGDVRPRGEDVVSALHDWMKKELVDGSSRQYDLGKFLFGSSTGSIGLLLSLLAVSQKAFARVTPCCAAVAFVLATFVACALVVPRMWTLHGGSDLFQEYVSRAHFARRALAIWLLLWLLGLLLSILSMAE
jgi:hypothetical protein